MGRTDHFADGATPSFRNSTPAKPDDYGVRYTPRSEAPESVAAHHEMLGVNNDKHGTLWEGAKVETIHPSTPVRTTQDQVGVEHVEGYAKRLKADAKTPVDFKKPGATEEDQDNGRPRLVRLGGELWHIDGLHRLAAARSKGRAIKARVWDADDHASKENLGPPPGDHWGLVDHIYHEHIHDNTYIDDDTDAPEHEVRSYHEELHRTGVADHRHE